MHTSSHPTNTLIHPPSHTLTLTYPPTPPRIRLYLIDFGAAREYPRGFVDDYLRMVHACAERDGPEVIHRSVRLGFLTGDEGEVMLEAHTQAGFAVGTPFGTEGLYDFGAHGGLTQRITALGTIMLKHRCVLLFCGCFVVVDLLMCVFVCVAVFVAVFVVSVVVFVVFLVVFVFMVFFIVFLLLFSLLCLSCWLCLHPCTHHAHHPNTDSSPPPKRHIPCTASCLGRFWHA